jgi:uncharacterized protein (DUF1800 family)
MHHFFRSCQILLVSSALLASLTPWRAAQAQAVSDQQMLNHLLRRFAFSAPPETVNRMLAAAPGAGWLAISNAWLAQQISLTQDVNSAAVPLEPPPAHSINGGDDQDYERGFIEHSIGTNQQLRAKMELHWLDHFSVVGGNSGRGEMMDYDRVVRLNALGNFKTLLIGVAEEPAELYSLSNDNNIGSNLATPPNVNFAREVMQLFTMGPFKLNMDGSVVKTAKGAPVGNYTDGDIYTLAYAMTGYTVGTDPGNPNPYEQVFGGYNSANHYRGDPKTFNGLKLNHFMGQTLIVPGKHPMEFVAGLLANNPSTAPFQAKELLQRFVTENPAPDYVERIAQVWAANVDAPNQIALVVTAIVNDPAFPSSYHSMPKQPVEKLFGFLRQLPGAFAPLVAASGSNVTTANGAGSLQWQMNNLGQNVFYPNNVFSFYPPGQVEKANTQVSFMSWTGAANWLTQTDGVSRNGVGVDIAALRRRIAAANGNGTSPAEITSAMVARYLLGVMLDMPPAGVNQIALNGGAPNNIVVQIFNQLGSVPTDQQIMTVIWLIAVSPRYNVN